MATDGTTRAVEWVTAIGGLAGVAVALFGVVMAIVAAGTWRETKRAEIAGRAIVAARVVNRALRSLLWAAPRPKLTRTEFAVGAPVRWAALASDLRELTNAAYLASAHLQRRQIQGILALDLFLTILRNNQCGWSEAHGDEEPLSDTGRVSFDEAFGHRISGDVQKLVDQVAAELGRIAKVEP